MAQFVKSNKAHISFTSPHTVHIYLLSILFLLLTSCAPSPTPTTGNASGTSIAPLSTTAVKLASTSTPTLKPQAGRFTRHILLQGGAHPDDVAFDQQGHLLFSDERNGTIGRLNADGSVTRVLNDPNGPEGMVVLPDGTIIFGEQETHRIVSLAPGAKTPTILRALPGTPSKATCKDGVDAIALDPTTNTLIIPDSPTGEVYRMSLDGKTFTLLAKGMVRPVGAGIDAQGTIYVADECGNAVWSITPAGKTTRIGGFGMPDDVLPDGHGNLLVIDLAPRIHSLIRLHLATGQRETLASQGFIEPQGLALDAQGNIYVSDDFADIIVQFTPA